MSDECTGRSAAVVATAAENHFANGGARPRSKSVSNGPLPIHTNFSNTPVKLTTQDSSNVMGQDEKRMENLLCLSEKPFSATNLNISKEVTSTPVMNTENDKMSILKKLPAITFSVIQPEPVFKVPDIPTKYKKTPRNVITEKPKVVHKKNILTEKQESYIGKKILINFDEYEELEKILNLTQKQKQKKVQNNIPLVNNNDVINIISRNTETASNNNTVSDRENKIRTSSNKIPKIPRNCQIEFKKQISNNSIVSSALKTNSNNDSVINNMTNNKDIKTSGSTKGDYKLMDTSTKGKIDIVPATFPPDFFNTIPEYEGSVQKINKLSEDNYTQYTSLSRVDKEPLTRQEPNFFRGHSRDIITSMDIIETNNINFDKPQSHLAKGNVYSNLAEKITEGDSTYCIKPVEEILPNILCDSSNC